MHAMEPPKIHLYESLCKELNTEYFLDAPRTFSTIIHTLDEKSTVAARVRYLSLLKGPAKGLSNLLISNPVVTLEQIQNDYGWFKVLPGPRH